MKPTAPEQRSPVVVVDYAPRWADLFAQLRATIWPLVQDIATGLEHVGSTSVPGLPVEVLEQRKPTPDDRTKIVAANQAPSN
jgi:hypothetical protein